MAVLISFLNEIEKYLQQQIKTRIIQMKNEKKLLEEILKVRKTLE